VHDPDVVVGPDRDAGDLAQNPVFRQRFWPERLGWKVGGASALAGCVAAGPVPIASPDAATASVSAAMTKMRRIVASLAF